MIFILPTTSAVCIGTEMCKMCSIQINLRIHYEIGMQRSQCQLLQREQNQKKLLSPQQVVFRSTGGLQVVNRWITVKWQFTSVNQWITVKWQFTSVKWWITVKWWFTSVKQQITVKQQFTLVKYLIPGLQLFFS